MTNAQELQSIIRNLRDKYSPVLPDAFTEELEKLEESLKPQPSFYAIEAQIKAEREAESKKMCGTCRKSFPRGTNFDLLKVTVDGPTVTYFHEGPCWTSLWE